jgi:hypothetical protein
VASSRYTCARIISVVTWPTDGPYAVSFAPYFAEDAADEAEVAALDVKSRETRAMVLHCDTKFSKRLLELAVPRAGIYYTKFSSTKFSNKHLIYFKREVLKVKQSRPRLTVTPRRSALEVTRTSAS